MEVAGAIADPVRREILLMLRDGDLTVGEIVARFDISRPAISRHLRVLRDSGLVHAETTGRQRRYTLDVAPLTELAEWLTQFDNGSRWQRRFDALETEVHRTRRERRQRRERPYTAELSKEDTA
ncbi:MULTISPECIES: helix-turn-helix transcriptional regulator [Prauserella]|uniref:ArsR/SmtB family transcription factor n=1 Tax=Prauserella TaxID=142577 RepID=UPI001E5FCD5E|nr:MULTISPECIES: metalloregulator ArsR/SmtB family transcription factor [Prauserella]